MSSYDKFDRGDGEAVFRPTDALVRLLEGTSWSRHVLLFGLGRVAGSRVSSLSSDRAVCSIQGSEATKPGEHVGPPGHVSGQIVGRVEWSARSRATSAGVYGTDFSSNSLQPPSR
jgi:hypothetical protein